MGMFSETAGLDPVVTNGGGTTGTTEIAAIYDVIVGLAREGMAVIVVSSELEEVLGLSHQVLVLARGEQRGVLHGPEATDVKVMHLATA